MKLCHLADKEAVNLRFITVKLFIFTIMVTLTTGCQFFGKEVPKADPTRAAAPILDAIQGAWSYIDVAPAVNNTPDSVTQTRFRFDGLSGFQLEFEDLLLGGITTTATGRFGYSAASDTLTAFLLTSSNDPSGNLAGASLSMHKPKVEDHIFSYEDSHSAAAFMFAALTSPVVPPPIGVWKFDGAFDIDFIVITSSGYGVVQMRDHSNVPYLVDVVVSARVTGQLQILILGSGPDDVLASLSFDAYSVTATSLTLTVANVSHSGSRL